MNKPVTSWHLSVCSVHATAEPAYHVQYPCCSRTSLLPWPMCSVHGAAEPACYPGPRAVSMLQQNQPRTQDHVQCPCLGPCAVSMNQPRTLAHVQCPCCSRTSLLPWPMCSLHATAEPASYPGPCAQDAEKGLVTLGKIPVCAQLAVLIWVDEPCSSVIITMH